MTRVAVITPDVLGAQMAGPAIRAFELAKVLSRDHEVQLLSTASVPELLWPGVEFRHGSRHVVADTERWADVIFFQGNVLTQFPWLMKSECVLVSDLYDPVHLELLHQNEHHSLFRRSVEQQLSLEALRRQLTRCDYFVCASPKQRDLWLGHLAAWGRLNPQQYDADPSLSALVGIVPFGLAPEVPPKNNRVLRGVVGNITTDDVVVIWGGGLYPWLDPEILVQAVASAARAQERLKVVFLAGRHPNPDVPEMATTRLTKEAAERLGLRESHVFFIEDWVPYELRHEYLLEADIGISTHLLHVETAFSFRTRVLDYLWCGLPIISSDGDHMARFVGDQRLGAVVRPGSVEELSEALIQACDASWRRDCAKRVEQARLTFEWNLVAEPLVNFCRHPRRAVDLELPRGPFARQRGLRAKKVGRTTRWLRQAARAQELLREGQGWSRVLQKVRARLSRAGGVLRRP